MKILVYSESFLPNLGGLERNTISLCNALGELGHSVTLLTPTRQSNHDAFTFRVIRSKKFYVCLYELFRQSLLVVNGGLSLKTCLPALLLRMPFITIYQSSTLYRREGRGWVSNANNVVREYVAKKAAVSVGVSSYAADCLPDDFRKAVLYNPVDPQLERCIGKLHAQPVTPRYDVLFAGRVIEGKGIFVLAAALEILKDRFQTLTCAIAGEGAGLEQLRSLALKRDLNMTFLGRVDQEQLIDAYAASKMLVVPSTTHIEGNPLVIAEAITVGIPVIASNQPAMVEAIGDAGMIFTSGDAAELAEKIHTLLEDAHANAQCSQRCATLRDKFSYRSYSDRLNRIITTLKLKAGDDRFCING